MKRIRKLFSLVKGNWLIFAFTVVLTVFHRLSFSYVPLFSEYVMKKLQIATNLPSNGQEVNLPNFIINLVEQYSDVLQSIIMIIILLVVWQAVRYVILYIEAISKGRLSENVGKNLRMNSYDHIQNLSYDYHNNADSGDLIQRVTSDIDATTSFVSYRIMDLIGIMSSLTFGAFQMFHVNKTIMLVSIAIIPITAISSIWYFKKIEKMYTDVEEKESELMVIIQENVSASKVVRAFANEQYEIEKMDQKNQEYRETEIKANKVSALYWGAMDTLMMVQFTIVLLLGIYFSRQNIMDVATISSSLMLAGMLIWPVRGLGRIINDFGKALVASKRLEEVFNEQSEYVNDGILIPNIDGHIIFKNVNFKFPNTTNYLLKNINFEIFPGETIAIIGKTGSGKTTIINILLKMYDYEGSVLIDGVELRDINKKHLRSNIGTVLQDPFLYSKTVLENIAIANPNSDNEAIIEASKTASLESDINTFQDGYDTIVGEQGTTLSGGQKQRVAIARILVAEKPIIIFDDALSALDNKTDLDIRNALNKKTTKQTSIIITHRMTTAKDASKIIVINNGTIEKIGTHTELSNTPGLYNNLWGIQGKLEEEFFQMIKDGK